MYLSKAYYFAGRYTEAAELLTKHSRIKPDDAYLWYLLAEDNGQAGNILGVHLARAEYFKLNGAMQQGIEQLNLALPLARDNVMRERIQTRLLHFHNIARAFWSNCRQVFELSCKLNRNGPFFSGRYAIARVIRPTTLTVNRPNPSILKNTLVSARIV